MREKSVLLGLMFFSAITILQVVSFFFNWWFQWEFLIPLLTIQSFLIIFMGLNLYRKPRQKNVVQRQNMNNPTNMENKKNGICDKCGLPLDLCECEKTQSSKITTIEKKEGFIHKID